MSEKDLNVLFVCHSGQMRSQTAKDLFADRWNTKAIGLYPYPNYHRLNPKLEKMLVWADKVYVMKAWMESTINKYYPKHKDKIINLDIEDHFSRGDPFLINLLKDKVK